VVAQHPQLREKQKLTVLITSAEELAVKGAMAYVLENETYLRHQADGSGLHVLNFDGIGVDGKIFLVGGERGVTQTRSDALYDLIQRCAEELGIPVGRFSLPGALFDHIPFAKEGFDALSMVGIGKSTWVIHSTNDSLEKLHVNGFDRAGRLATRVIEKITGIL
jgi:Zn-dependent M28 family amino/carboxypeptidase